DQGKRVEAEGQFRKAIAILEKLASDFPAVPVYHQELADNHNTLGNLLSIMGQWAEAEHQLRLALAIREKLAADFPAVPEYRVELGGCYCNFGLLVRNGGKPAESLAWFQKAINILTAAHENEPRDVTASNFLRNSHAGRAKTYHRLEKY